MPIRQSTDCPLCQETVGALPPHIRRHCPVADTMREQSDLETTPADDD